MDKYKKNYLSRVIFRVDFAESVAIGSLGDYHEKIKTFFPIKEEKEGRAGFVQFNFESGEVKKESEKIVTWNFFTDEEKNKKLDVATNYILLEYNLYSDSSELFSHIQNTVLPFINKFKVKTISRVGLRYINEIVLNEVNQLDWTAYINEKLITNLSFIQQIDKEPARVLSTIVLKEENGDINFNYGMWNSEFPNKINRKEFILDFDCHTKLAITDDEILDTAKLFHSYIESLFEASITEGFKTHLNS